MNLCERFCNRTAWGWRQKEQNRDSWKSFTNNTNTNQTDFSQTDLINLSVESANSGVKVVRMDDPMRIRKQYENYLREKLSIDILI